ncbi:MAG: Hpt domain-containing protein [Parvularculaceae bacterium]
MADPIDLKHLDQYVCGDAGLLDEILSLFVEQATRWARCLSADMDDEEWRHAAHTLKGASRGVGAWALGDIAERAEAMTGGRTGERKALLAELAQQSECAIAFALEVRDRAA